MTRGRILLADDDFFILDSISDRCSLAGYEVITARSGAEALDTARASRLDAIILDIDFGPNQMDGYEVCDRLRNTPATAGIPIIILSGHMDIKKSFGMADDAQLKPPDLELLKGDVDELLGRLWQVILEYRLRTPVRSALTFTYEPPNRMIYAATGAYTHSRGDEVDLRQQKWARDMHMIAADLSAHHATWRATLDAGDEAADDAAAARANRDNWRAKAASVGQELHEALFERLALRRIWDRVRPKQGLDDHRLALRFCGPRDALAIPFELLQSSGLPLAIRYPISRQISGDEDPPEPKWIQLLKQRQRQPFRALLIAAEKRACKEVEAVAAKLRAALERVDVQVAIEPDDLSKPMSLREAVERLGNASFDLIHFAGHGDVDPQRPDQSFLVMIDDQGQPARLLATSLAGLLRPAPPQFLYLSCCLGAEVGAADALRDNAYLGLLDAAVQAGVPAVLGHRWPVVGAWARAFAEHFYDGLLHYPASLEHAAWWARKEIFHNSADIGWNETWFTPILIVQNPDGPAEV